MARELGAKQYEKYIAERSQSQISFQETNCHSSQSSNKGWNKTSSATSDSLKSDCQLFSRLYIACQLRDGDLQHFFAHENQPEHPSLTTQGKLRKGTKSDRLPCLETNGNQTSSTTPPSVTVKTFANYADNEFIPYIKAQLKDFKGWTLCGISIEKTV